MNAQDEIAQLQQIISNQQRIIEDLVYRLSLYENKKNSKNSSIPPSQDPFGTNKTTSLREKSGKKVGGQSGHEGSTLEMVENPDEIIEHSPQYCSICGKDLSQIESHFEGRRQLVDIPPIVPIITEHVIYSKQCTCGHCQKSNYPIDVHSPICYGTNIKAMTAYLHTRQYIPYGRMQEMFTDVFGVNISSGSLVNLMNEFAKKSEPIYQQILDKVGQSDVVGGDETGVRINGKNQWAWTFQSKLLTYIFVHTSRGKKAIEDIFTGRFSKSVLVHDCWSSYFSTDVETHQICTAHLLRELKYLDQLYQNPWTNSFTNLIHDALELKRTLVPSDYLMPIAQRADLEKLLDNLLQSPINSKHKKLGTFKERIVKYRDFLFQFLYYQNAPPDNNASERAIRTFKVKQKVSGLFRSQEGAQNFAIIRSIIDTTIKNKQNVLNALTTIAKC